MARWRRKYRLEIVWERKLADAWVGVYPRIDDLGRVHLWLILPPLGLPCLPLHLSWNSPKRSSDLRWVYVVDQGGAVMQVVAMPLRVVEEAERLGALEVAGVTYQVTGVTVQPWDDESTALLVARIKVHNPDLEANPPPADGWTDWDDFYERLPGDIREVRSEQYDTA
jgi:hypothetical protein